MKESSSPDFQYLPSIDRILQSPGLESVIRQFGQNPVRAEARMQLDDLRQQIVRGEAQVGDRLRDPDFLGKLCIDVETAVAARFQSSLIPVFNLTGTVVHTNLGRAALPEQAISAMENAARGPVNLEYDLLAGKRGDRDTHLEKLICELTGAEAATVVNNNAAAVVLVLTSLAVNRDVLISRGELVEIGGSFRIPEVMGSAGCNLKEVGATNRTHLDDYEKAIDENTALIMKVHTSNYEIRGFTRSVGSSELATLAGKYELPFVADLGSGTLVDLQQYGLPNEPTVQSALASGADLVTFSGDKLLGGPQAGIIVGKKELIDKLKGNPLKRALRIDKMTLAALVEVIFLYRDPAQLPLKLPILRDLTRPIAEIEIIAQRVLPALQECLEGRAHVSLLPCKSQIGSGALPLELLESLAIAIVPIAEKGGADKSLQRLALAFRKLPVPTLGRIHDGRLLFDLRCLYEPGKFCDQLAGLDTDE